MAAKVQNTPEMASARRQKGLDKGSASTEYPACDQKFSPSQKVWQQLHAGYQDERWKGDSVEGAEDKQKA
jgi:hypothetical protein